MHLPTEVLVVGQSNALTWEIAQGLAATANRTIAMIPIRMLYKVLLADFGPESRKAALQSSAGRLQGGHTEQAEGSASRVLLQALIVSLLGLSAQKGVSQVPLPLPAWAAEPRISAQALVAQLVKAVN